MHFVFDSLNFILGFVVGGGACAVSAKVFGLFNKGVKAVEVKAGLAPK